MGIVYAAKDLGAPCLESTTMTLFQQQGCKLFTWGLSKKIKTSKPRKAVRLLKVYGLISDSH